MLLDRHNFKVKKNVGIYSVCVYVYQIILRKTKFSYSDLENKFDTEGV